MGEKSNRMNFFRGWLGFFGEKKKFMGVGTRWNRMIFLVVLHDRASPQKSTSVTFFSKHFKQKNAFKYATLKIGNVTGLKNNIQIKSPTFFTFQITVVDGAHR